MHWSWCICVYADVACAGCPCFEEVFYCIHSVYGGGEVYVCLCVRVCLCVVEHKCSLTLCGVLAYMNSVCVCSEGIYIVYNEIANVWEIVSYFLSSPAYLDGNYRKQYIMQQTTITKQLKQMNAKQFRNAFRSSSLGLTRSTSTMWMFTVLSHQPLMALVDRYSDALAYTI